MEAILESYENDGAHISTPRKTNRCPTVIPSTVAAASPSTSYTINNPVPHDHPALHGSLTPSSNSPTSKILNFSPGPTSLPPAVEDAIQQRCFPQPTDNKQLRLGSMALSHRSPEFSAILKQALHTTRTVMQVPPEYEILFTQGGGHGQFAAVPMNLCPTGSEVATYVVNGTWSKRAVEEAKKYCVPHVISALNEDGSCTSFPSLERIENEINVHSQFLYVCSNETVNGLELHRLLPTLKCGVPLVVDASSDFTSKPIAWRESNIGVLFACASKNIGHPGITMVIIRKNLLGRANAFTPGILNYETNILADNVWNTIPTFNVDVVGIMMEWISNNGGIANMERMSVAKSDLVYDTIDNSKGFYGTPVEKACGYRSRMNVPFCVAGGDETLTDLFLVECWQRGIVGLRTITPFGKGIYLRASLYHGVAYDEVVVLTNLMKNFAAKHSIPKVEETRTTLPSRVSVPLFRQKLDGERPMDVEDMNTIKFTPHKEFPPYVQFAAWTGLSTSPDTITVAFNTLTLPKSYAPKTYVRVNNDMFAPSPQRDASPPPSMNLR